MDVGTQSCGKVGSVSKKPVGLLRCEQFFESKDG
jgi:hypothetical protein